VSANPVSESYTDAISGASQGAGQLVSLTTICKGVFRVTSIKDLRGALSWPMVAVALAPVACWLLSIIFALTCRCLSSPSGSADTAKDLRDYMRQRIASLRRGLQTAHILLVAGLIALMIKPGAFIWRYCPLLGHPLREALCHMRAPYR